jgi:hypothetical protein
MEGGIREWPKHFTEIRTVWKRFERNEKLNRV